MDSMRSKLRLVISVMLVCEEDDDGVLLWIVYEWRKRTRTRT